jgi:hypothetical protein
MRKMIQRNAILIYFVHASNWCKLCVGVCKGKPYCPYMNGAHFGCLESLLMNGLPLTGKEWMELFSLCYSVILVGIFLLLLFLFVFWAIVLLCNRSLQETDNPPNPTSCLCLPNGEITSMNQHTSLVLVLFTLNVGIIAVRTSDVEMQLSFEKIYKWLETWFSLNIIIPVVCLDLPPCFP